MLTTQTLCMVALVCKLQILFLQMVLKMNGNGLVLDHLKMECMLLLVIAKIAVIVLSSLHLSQLIVHHLLTQEHKLQTYLASG